MSDSPQNRAAELVEQGANALKVGNIAEAYATLREAVKLEPNNERAWLWLAGAVPSDDQRRFCLERVLQINPENTAAKRGLTALPASNPPPAPATPQAAQPVPRNTPAPAPPGRTGALFDPLAQPTARPAAPKPAEPQRAETPAVVSQPTIVPLTTAESQRIDGPQPSRNSLELLQREQQDQPVPSTTTRPSFVKSRLGKEAKSDPKAGAKPVSQPHVGSNTTPSLRPDIPIVGPKRTIDRGILAIIGLCVVLLAVLGLIGYLIMAQLDQRNRQAAAPTEPVAGEPTATIEPTATSIPPTPTPDPEALLAQARTFAESGNHQSAVEVYSQLLGMTESADVFFERGNSYFALEDYPKATADFSATLRLRPGDVGAYENRARSNLRAEKYADAISDYTEALRLNPDNAISFFRRGVAYQLSGQLELGQADFTSALQLKPDYPGAYLNRGNIFRQQGDLKSATDDYNAALKLDPDYVDALIARGTLAIDAKRYKAGVEDCNHAIEVDPNNPNSFSCRGRAYVGLKQYKQALEDFNSSLELQADQPQVFQSRARVQLLLGDKEAARADFEQAAKLFEQQGDSENLALVRAELEKLK